MEYIAILSKRLNRNSRYTGRFFLKEIINIGKALNFLPQSVAKITGYNFTHEILYF